MVLAIPAAEAPVSFVEEIAKKFKGKPHVQAVANAITEVIKERKGPLAPASYFALILTSLSDGTEKTEDEIASLLTLLVFVFEKISIAVLRSQFNYAIGVLLNIFEQCAQSIPILTKLTKCVSLLLQAQDLSVLQQHESMNTMQMLLTLSTDERAPVVRAAQSSVLSIMKSGSAPVRKMWSQSLTYFFKTVLSEAVGAQQAAILVLKLIKQVFPYLTPANIGSLCEAIMQVPVHALSSLTTASYQAILGLLTPKEETEDEEMEDGKSDGKVELGSAQLVSLAEALLAVQPHFNDARPMVEYAFLMASLLATLASVDEDACAKKLPTIFEMFVPNFASESGDIASATHDALTVLIQKAMSDKMIEQGVKAAKSPLRQIVSTMETSLSPQYHRNWDKALLVIANLFERLGQHAAAVMGPILMTVGELYNNLTPQTHMPVFAVLGYAISAMGAKNFLAVLPLNLESPESGGGDAPNRMWLLPLLRSNIEQTELKYFIDYFIPLATQISVLAAKAEAGGKVVEAKNKQIVHDQIWDLFPAFCDLPVDLTASFKSIAKTLGSAITDTPARRKVIYGGLQKLLDKNKELAESESEGPARVTPAMAKSGLKAMAAFSKNFLPIFFAQYEKMRGDAASDLKQRDALFNLMSAYISITDPQVVTQFFKTLMQKLLEASTEPKNADAEMDDDSKKEAAATENKRRVTINTYTDLASAFVPSLTLTDLDFLYRVIKPYFKSQNIHLQKKSYKVLRALCAQPTFLKKSYDELRDVVLNTMNECTSTAKKQRIAVLQEMLPHMSLKDIMSPALIADVIFSAREISNASRKMALQLIVKMAQKVQEEEEDGLQTFVNLLVAGLAGTTPVMMRGSIYALTEIVTQFQDMLEASFINELVSTLILLLQSSHVEVMTATVHFLKSTLNIVDMAEMENHLKPLAEGFAMMMRDHRGKFREFGAPVMTKLIRRFGYERLAPMFPEDCQKVLRSINKHERQKKDKTKKEKTEKGDESSSDEDDAEFLGENLLGDKAYDKEAADGETFIVEDEEPVDFLDKKAIKQVTSAKPQKVDKTKKKNEFKMLPDGRLIIQDSDEEDHEMYYDGKEKLPVDDRMLDQVDRELFGGKSRRMTKKRMLEAENRAEDQDEDDNQEAVKPVNEKFKRNNRPSQNKKYAGHQFKAKKAGGDIKIGAVEPFAYIPLDLKNLNKRRRQHAVTHFKAIATAGKNK